MKLKRIVLTDFRCFYDEQVIDFSFDRDKNVTLIHAENGVGKTTLLNALIWCFYGDTTARFEMKEDIVNHQARKEGRYVAAIEVEFEHEGQDYTANRAFDARNPHSDSQLKVSELTFGDAIPKTIDAPSLFINSVLPKDMAGHFLFDGEHAERISGEANKQEIHRAIKDILGASIVSQSIYDLTKVLDKQRKNAAGATKDKKVDELQLKIDEIQERLDRLAQKIDNASMALEKNRKHQTDLKRKLGNVAAIKEIKAHEASLVNLISGQKREIDSFKSTKQSWLSSNGKLLFAKGIKKVFDEIQEEKTSDENRYPVDRNLVKDLLDKGTCICGCDLKAGSDHEKLLRSLLDKTKSIEFEKKVTRVKQRMNALIEASKKINTSFFSDNGKKIETKTEEISKNEGSLNEVRERLQNSNVAEIASMENKLALLRDEEISLSSAITENRNIEARLESEIKGIETQIDQFTYQSHAASKFLAKKKITERLKDRLDTKLKEDLAEARKVINGKIKKIFDATVRKNINVRVNEDFSISLKSTDGIELPKSSGENQLVGLIFTAALAEYAKIRQNAKDQLLLPGTEAPLVLDAPFGQLDGTYKTATAEYIPSMASQVVVMVSKEQGSENVLSILEEKIGSRVTLVRHNIGEQGDKKPEFINVDNEEIEITKYGSDREGTEIRQITYG